MTQTRTNSAATVLFASLIGTTIEFFDFYIYATAAVLVFPRLFFPASDPATARLASLATIGSAAPFIGLFGTVIGIMTSFQGIAASKSTNLAVVAPGIAEALLATAIGLVAAIPAVIAYNKFSGDAGKLVARMEAFADEFSAILSRQIDERLQPRQAAQ